MDASVFDPIMIAVVAVAVALITLILVIILAVRQRRLLKRYRLLLNGAEGKNIEQLLLDQGADIERLQAGQAALERWTQQLADEAMFHAQKIGTVRFSAFPDTGSDLSFAIALLDAHDNGVVLSSLYGRSESRTYAKPIQGGKSTYQLSDEEKEAIAKAIATRQTASKVR